jgi:putative sterol carrier protein
MLSNMRFPSAQWLSQYVVVINQSREFVDKTRGWVWVILFVFEVDPRHVSPSPGFRLDIADGACRSYEYLEDTRGQHAPYRVWGPIRVWEDLRAGRISAVDALGQGRIRVSANQATLGRFVETVKVLLNHLQKVG